MPEINLPTGVGLILHWRDTNQAVRLAGLDFRPGGPGGFFQELPQALMGSLEPSDAGGVIVSLGTLAGAGVSTNALEGVMGQPVEVVLRTPRGEQQSFKLRIEGVSRERSPTVRISVGDRVAMKNWWFNSTNIVEREGFDMVTIRAADAARASALATQLRQQGFSVQSLEAFVTIANRIVTVVTMMFLLVGGIALLVATIGIANTMVMAIYERTREIGILKAMGASPREIRQLFMLEAGWIGLMGGVAGVGLGWLLGLALNQAAQAYAHYRETPMPEGLFLVSLPLVIGAVGFAALIGLLAGLLPAHRAARLNPLDALRHE
jgi:putative ABC transport system permease protein